MGNITSRYIAVIKSLSDEDKVSLIVGLMKHRDEVKTALGCAADACHEDVLKRATLCAERPGSP